MTEAAGEATSHSPVSPGGKCWHVCDYGPLISMMTTRYILVVSEPLPDTRGDKAKQLSKTHRVTTSMTNSIREETEKNRSNAEEKKKKNAGPLGASCITSSMLPVTPF